MTDVDYLKGELGAAVASGMAATVLAQPEDPVEYLALWLLQHVQKKQQAKLDVDRQLEVERERAQWAADRAVRETEAAMVLQTSWRRVQHKIEERRAAESELREQLALLEEAAADDDVPEEDLAFGSTQGEGTVDSTEMEIADERAEHYVTFRRSLRCLDALNGRHLRAALEHTRDKNESVELLLRCCLYAQGEKASAVDSMQKIRRFLKPVRFLQWARAFDPVYGDDAPRQRIVCRISRLFSKIAEDEIKDTSIALHTLFIWLRSAMLYRQSRDRHLLYRRDKGRDIGGEEVDSESDEGPVSPDDVDMVEEEIRQEEDEQERSSAESDGSESRDEGR